MTTTTQSAREGAPRKFANTARYQKSRSLAQPHSDWALVIVMGLLVVLGLVMAYSTTFYMSATNPAYGGDPFAIFKVQLTNLLFGIVAFIIVSRMDYSLWKRFSLPIIAITIVVLGIVLLWGSDVNGARRTILDGRVQPSELAKVTILCYGATWLASRRGQLTNFMNGLLPFAAIIGISVGTIILQPDLSTAIIIIIAAFGMLFLAGASIPQMAIISVVGLSLFGLMLTLNFFPHAAKRVLESWAGIFDFNKASEHIQYAMLAVTGGGWFGKGVGAGFAKFINLPAPHTDSVFAVLAEELGLVGVVVTLGLFVLLAYRGLIIARRSDSPFGSYFAMGIIMWLLMQAVLNMLANVGWLPLPGVPVPFLSIGGSSLVAVMVGCGVLFSISRGSRLLTEEEDGNEDKPQRRNVYGANNSIRRWDSRSRAARTDRAEESENVRSTSIIGRDIRFSPRLRRDNDSSVVRWRKGRNGTGPRLTRGR